MLTPEYLATFAQGYMGYVDILNEQICKDIARRIVKTGDITSTAKWQVEMAQQSGKLLEDISKDVGLFTGYSEKTIRNMFKDAGIKSVTFDGSALVRAGILDKALLSPSAQDIMIANAIKTAGDVTNLSLTTAVQGQQSFIDAVNEAVMKVQSGAFSQTEAIKQAILQCSSEGAHVQYANRRMSLDAAINMCVRTSVNQTCGKMTEIFASENGCEYYEVSAHFGARPSHQEWQGEVYKIDGSDGQYANFEDSTGYGEVDGLCGVNCRHSFYPFWPSLSQRAYTPERLQEMAEEHGEYNGVDYSGYELSQKQRGYESAIRRTKRELASLNAAIEEADNEELKKELKEEFATRSKRLRVQTDRLKDFCSQTGRTRDRSREQVHASWDANGNVVKYGHSTASKAVWAAKK